MKAKINGYEVECSVSEFRELIREPKEKTPKRTYYGKKMNKKTAMCGKAWSMAEIKQLIDLNQKGISSKEIGKSLGRSAKAVTCRKTILKKKKLIV